MSDQQAAALRAAMALDETQAREWRVRLIGSGDLDGFSELVYAAFTLAVRRYFAPEQARGDIVRYVGGVPRLNCRFRVRPSGISPGLA